MQYKVLFILMKHRAKVLANYILLKLKTISRPTQALILLSGLSCLLELTKIVLKNDFSGLGLIWNLFLAWVPLFFILLSRRFLKKGSRIGIYGNIFMWLLFFPNTTYIITDLIHIPEYAGVLLWYDSLRIFLFALAGLATGLYSLLVLHQVLNTLFRQKTAWYILSFSVFLSGYGIYLGRFVRFNSWDLFTNPFALIRQILDDVNNPLAIHTTFAFAFVTMVLYVCLNLVIRKPNPENSR